jgi:hypothetical protein
MSKDKALWSVIGDEKSIFIRLLNHLWSSRLSINESKQFSIRLGAGKAEMTNGEGEQATRDFVLIREIDYKVLGRELNTSKSTIYNYIKAFVRPGILKQLRKDGPRGKIVYAVGYFQPFKTKNKSGFKYIPFVNGKMKPALRKFNV